MYIDFTTTFTYWITTLKLIRLIGAPIIVLEQTACWSQVCEFDGFREAYEFDGFSYGRKALDVKLCCEWPLVARSVIMGAFVPAYRFPFWDKLW